MCSGTWTFMLWLGCKTGTSWYQTNALSVLRTIYASWCESSILICQPALLIWYVFVWLGYKKEILCERMVSAFSFSFRQPDTAGTAGCRSFTPSICGRWRSREWAAASVPASSLTSSSSKPYSSSMSSCSWWRGHSWCYHKCCFLLFWLRVDPPSTAWSSSLER